MKNKVLPDINEAEANYEELKTKRKVHISNHDSPLVFFVFILSFGNKLHMLKFQESDQKASEICPESEILSLGPWDGSTPEQLSAQINRMDQRLHRENQQCVFFSIVFQLFLQT